MNQESASPPPATRDIEIRRHLLRMLMRHMPGAVATNLTIAVCAAGFTWSETQDPLVWTWLALLAVVVLPRLIWWRRMKRDLDSLDATGIRHAEQQALVLLTAAAVIWGNIAWLSHDPAYGGPGIFTIGVLIGLTGGAVTPLSYLRNAYPVYAVCTLAPLMLKFILTGNAMQLSGAAGVLLYLFMLITYARVTHQAFWNLFRLQLEQDGLIADLQALDRSRSLFLAGVSHDLRQPVHAMGMFTGYLSRVAENEAGDLGVKLRQLSDSSKRALAIINNQVTRLLELSRFEAGEVQAKRQTIVLTELFDVAQAQHLGPALGKGIELRFVVSRLAVDSDATMLQSIVDNLISNAVRYTRQGRVLFGVRRRGREAELQVWDTGPGIVAAQIPLLFEAYRRFDDTAVDHELGFGLGLALVKKQADLLGHAIIVRSLPGRGSLFAVRVPIRDAE